MSYYAYFTDIRSGSQFQETIFDINRDFGLSFKVENPFQSCFESPEIPFESPFEIQTESLCVVPGRKKND